MQPALRSSLRGALDLILPPQALDGGARPMSPGLSAASWAAIQFLDDPVCDGCGLPFEFSLGAGVRCPACMAKPRAFARARAACLYDDASRDLILQLKHADRPELANLFAAWLSRAGAELVAEAEMVAPIPLHPLRLFRRRYNQAGEMARVLARRLAKPYAPDLLRRHRATDSQGGKSARGRRLNVRGAFEVPAAAVAKVRGRRVLLVDDVMTTGATAEACARALIKAGAHAVDVVMVARVREAANPLI